MALINLTPERFVHCILLGLYWQHWPPKEYTSRNKVWYQKSGFSTVDHVMKILMSLNHLTAAQVSMVGHKQLGLSHQRKLRHHCAYYHGEQLLSDKWSYLVIRGRDLGSNCNLRKLVINQSLEILPAGVEVACRQESYFGTTYGVTKETYLKECERINALFKKEAASPSASTIYRQKVAKILGEE